VRAGWDEPHRPGAAHAMAHLGEQFRPNQPGTTNTTL